METVTQWFSMSKKPSRVGVYELRYRNHQRLFSRFENGMWHCACPLKNDAARVTKKSSMCYGDTITGWRGLAERPNYGN